MALSGDELGSAISSAISGLGDSAKSDPAAIWKAVGGAIVDHIKKATITVSAGIPVTTTGTAVAQSGVTSGPGSATIS